MMAGGSPSDEIAAKVADDCLMADEEGDMAKPLMDSQESSGALDDSFASASASDFPFMMCAVCTLWR